MKKIFRLFVVVLICVSMLVITVSADEKCILAENGAEGECEIWWIYDLDEHWQACVEHRDNFGNDTVVTEAVPHEFADGVCTVCEMKETKGIGGIGYMLVLAVMLIAIVTTSVKVKGVFKNANLEERPFGLDKFRKF